MEKNNYIKFDGNKVYCNFMYNNSYIKLQAKTEAELIKKIKQRQKYILFSEKEPNKEKRKKKTIEELFRKMLEIKNYGSTTEHKKEIMFNLYFSEIKNKDISEINNSLLLKWRNGVHRFVKIGKIKDNRFNRILEIMRSLLDVVKSLNLFNNNQYDTLILNRIKEDKSVSLKLLNNYITQDELKLFVEGIQLESTFFSTIPQNTFIFMVKFLYYTGLRINEARVVKVEDFIIDRRNDSVYYLLVNKQMLDNSYEIKKTLKINPERKMYLKKEIYKDFTKYFLEYNLKSNDFVFDYTKTGKSITRKVFLNFWLKQSED